ncbi:MAG: hypothetical protein ACD_40C00335G0002 [uncultured bacterium]|nr:MAG: hypothetical protein ACD_40C00335G0002 [uncultured bacterium]
MEDMDDTEPIHKLPSPQEIRDKLRDKKSEFHRRVPLIISTSRLEQRLTPVNSDTVVCKTKSAQEQFDLLSSFSGFQVYSDSGVTVIRVGNPENVQTYFVFEDNLSTSDESLTVPAKNIFFGCDGKVVSLLSLLPPGSPWEFVVESEIVAPDKTSSSPSISIGNKKITLGIMLNQTNISGSLHEIGHAWADYLQLDPSTDLQDLARLLISSSDDEELTPIELHGIMETSLSERLANMIGRLLV